MSLPLKNFSDYFFENLSIRAENQIQITSACNAKCIFCSNEQNPFKIHRCKFRPLEEIEKVVWGSGEITGPIMINESLPGRISEGEAFLHPQFFEVLGVIRRKYSNQINITTNGSFLNKETVENLAKFNPIQVQISFPSATEKYWTETFSLSDDKFENAKSAFNLLQSYGMNVFASITPMPAWVGWEDIEKTIQFLSNKGIKDILIYAPGFTNNTTPEMIERLTYDKEELSDFLQKISQKFKVTFSWSLDPKSELYVNHDALSNVLRNCFNEGRKKIIWLTSIAAADRFKVLINKLSRFIPIENEVCVIENITYGGNIECSGLWMIDDIRKQIKEYKEELIVSPSGFFDRYGFDLQSENINDFFKETENFFVFL